MPQSCIRQIRDIPFPETGGFQIEDGLVPAVIINRLRLSVAIGTEGDGNATFKQIPQELGILMAEPFGSNLGNEHAGVALGELSFFQQCRGQLIVHGSGNDRKILVPAPVAAPAAAPAASGAAGSVKVESPMPGKILAIKANVGQAVKKGDVVMILEAMKMENEIVAPADGTIAGINVAVGDSVESGDTLASMN